MLNVCGSSVIGGDCTCFKGPIDRFAKANDVVQIRRVGLAFIHRQANYACAQRAIFGGELVDIEAGPCPQKGVRLRRCFNRINRSGALALQIFRTGRLRSAQSQVFRYRPRLQDLRRMVA